MFNKLFRRIVYKNIKLAECLNSLFDCFFAKMLVTDISSDEQTLPPLLFNLPFRFFCIFVFIQINNCDVRPFFGEVNGDCASDTAVTPANERHFVF
jgi:hypothetical protein